MSCFPPSRSSSRLLLMPICVESLHDRAIDHHLPQVRPSGDRGNAHGRLPVFLCVQGLRRALETAAGRLLRVLFLWLRALPAGSSRARGRRGVLLRRVELRQFQRAHCRNVAGLDPGSPARTGAFLSAVAERHPKHPRDASAARASAEDRRPRRGAGSRRPDRCADWAISSSTALAPGSRVSLASRRQSIAF
jgi:hypothetical protein